MPNLAKHTFTSAIKSHTHKGLMEQTMSFQLFRWKKQSPQGQQELAQSMDARGNWGQNQHLTDSGVQNLSTKPYRAKTQESIVTWTAFQKDHLSPQLDPPNPSG